MIGAFVTFRYDHELDEPALRRIATEVRHKFEGMPGLRSKAFTLAPGRCEAVNFYVWESREAAEAFYTDSFRERVTNLYGVPPVIEFVEIATLVDNACA